MIKVLPFAAIGIALLAELLLRRHRGRLRTCQDHIRAANNALARGHLDRAEELFRAAVRLDHANAEAHFGLARAAWFRGDFDRTIEHLHQCQQWTLDHPDIEHGLAAAHHGKGDHEAAILHYRRAVELNPTAQETRQALASLYHDLGRDEDAQEVCPGFEPPSEAAVAKQEAKRRFWQQLGPAEQAGIARWFALFDVLVWVWRVSRVIVLSLLGIAVLIFIFYLAIRVNPVHRRFFPPPVKTLGIVAFIAMWASMLAIGLMRSLEQPYLRWLTRRARVPRADADAVLEPELHPPWWRVELSGAHLILWLGLPVLLLYNRSPKLFPEWFVVVVVWGGALWAAKLFYWGEFLLAGPEGVKLARRQYRWFATLPGALAALTAMAAIIAAFTVAFRWAAGPPGP